MKRNVYRLGLLTIFVFALHAGAASGQTTPPDSDFQVWTEDQLVFPLIKEDDGKGKPVDKLSLLILGTLRLGQNRLYPVDARVGAGFELRLNNSFTFTPTYIYRRGEDVRNRKDYEHRIRFDLTYTKRFKGFTFRDRNRVEYRIRNSRRDSVRYRNRATISIPVTREGTELFAPYFADEIFYDFREEKISRNEFSVGISRKLNKNVSADFYYLLRSNFTGTIRTVHGVGANFKFRID